jgi:hypothetical protein
MKELTKGDLQVISGGERRCVWLETHTVDQPVTRYEDCYEDSGREYYGHNVGEAG